ncbi:MAG: DALR anticodon-binding domain-containing protein, partial [Beijerinckiaceae bacterium]
NWERFSNVLEKSSLLSLDLLSFFHDRLKVMLREQGARHDLVDAVLGACAHPSPLRGRAGDGGGAEQGAVLDPAATPTPTPPRKGEGSQNDDLLSIVTRVNALSAFLATEDGKTLLAGTKRAVNILRAEEKKDGEGAFEKAIEASLLKEPAERDLNAALATEGAVVAQSVAAEDYAAAMSAMARLRAPVDAFLDGTFVNDPDPAIRVNRLSLLASLRRVTASVADFSKVAG